MEITTHKVRGVAPSAYEPYHVTVDDQVIGYIRPHETLRDGVKWTAHSGSSGLAIRNTKGSGFNCATQLEAVGVLIREYAILQWRTQPLEVAR